MVIVHGQASLALRAPLAAAGHHLAGLAPDLQIWSRLLPNLGPDHQTGTEGTSSVSHPRGMLP
ncbi:MAG: hypothetical protein DLM54_02085 [Acidimicrobiales bacterium]|nr:MAG: hypothetical protein DLM54_02085 [Acidimicrobiales bacterium]